MRMCALILLLNITIPAAHAEVRRALLVGINEYVAPDGRPAGCGTLGGMIRTEASGRAAASARRQVYRDLRFRMCVLSPAPRPPRRREARLFEHNRLAFPLHDTQF